MKVRLVDRGLVLMLDGDSTWAEEIGIPFGSEIEVRGWIGTHWGTHALAVIDGKFVQIPITTLEPVE